MLKLTSGTARRRALFALAPLPMVLFLAGPSAFARAVPAVQSPSAPGSRPAAATRPAPWTGMEFIYIQGVPGARRFYQFDFDTKTSKPLETAVAGDAWRAAWLPDGATLLLCARVEGIFKTWQMGPADAKPKALGFADRAKITISPDGQKMLVDRFAEERESDQGLFLGAPDGGVFRKIADGTAGLFSTDGSRILYRTERGYDKELHIYNILPGDTKARDLVVAKSTGLAGACWSPDGKIIYFSIKNDAGAWRIRRLAVDGSANEELTNGELDISPSISPDGTALAYLKFRRVSEFINFTEIAILQLSTRSTVVHPIGEAARGPAAAMGAKVNEIVWAPDSKSIAFVWSPNDCIPGAQDHLALLDVASGATRHVAGGVDGNEQHIASSPAWRPKAK